MLVDDNVDYLLGIRFERESGAQPNGTESRARLRPSTLCGIRRGRGLIQMK